MRDGSIIAAMESAQRRDRLILSQFEFLKTRQEAMETVMLGSAWWHKLLWVVAPMQWIKAVDGVQRALLERAGRDLAAAQAKPKIEVVGAA